MTKLGHSTRYFYCWAPSWLKMGSGWDREAAGGEVRAEPWRQDQGRLHAPHDSRNMETPWGTEYTLLTLIKNILIIYIICSR